MIYPFDQWKNRMYNERVFPMLSMDEKKKMILDKIKEVYKGTDCIKMCQTLYNMPALTPAHGIEIATDEFIENLEYRINMMIRSADLDNLWNALIPFEDIEIKK